MSKFEQKGKKVPKIKINESKIWIKRRNPLNSWW